MRPTSVLICGQPFQVVGVPRGERIIPLDWGDTTSDPNQCLGATSVVHQHIAIRDGMAPQAERDTVLHEVLHSLLRMTGASDVFDDEDEQETVVNALAVGMLAVLRQNVPLTVWLTDLPNVTVQS